MHGLYSFLFPGFIQSAEIVPGGRFLAEKCRISNRKQKSEGYRQSCQSRDWKGRIFKSYFRSKNEESGEGWRFPEEILPDLESSFLWSIMGAGGSILLLPSCLLMIRSYFHALSLFDICLLLPFRSLFRFTSDCFLPFLEIFIFSDSSDRNNAGYCGMKAWQAFRWEWVSYPVTSEGTLEKVNEPGSCVGLKMELSERMRVVPFSILLLADSRFI